MGMTFKENCPDIRNSKVITIIDELKEYHIKVDVWEPVADAGELSKEYGVVTVPQPKQQSYDGIVLAVKHQEFVTLGLEGIRNFLVPNGVLYDIKEIF